MVVQGEHKRLTLSVPEVAHMLGIGRNTAYELARAGKLPVVRLGKRFLVPVAALERWLEEQAQAWDGGDR
ncbi:MAG: helix-turn-helix domain-containing protein [Clostridiales bacterium]|nr:helix-turn-helix domain-containing protein [Clostridiales bacterium]